MTLVPEEPTASLVTEALMMTRLRAGKRDEGADQRWQRRAAMAPPEVMTIAVSPDRSSAARSWRAAGEAVLNWGQVWAVGLSWACSTHRVWAASSAAWKTRLEMGSPSAGPSNLSARSE